MNDVRTCPRCGRSLTTPGAAARRLNSIIEAHFQRSDWIGGHAIDDSRVLKAELDALARDLDCPMCPEETLFLGGLLVSP